MTVEAVVRHLSDEVGSSLPDGADAPVRDEVIGEHDTAGEAWAALAAHHEALEDAAAAREHVPGCPWSTEAGYHHSLGRLRELATTPQPGAWVFGDTPGACLCPENGIAERDFGRVYLVR